MQRAAILPLAASLSPPRLSTLSPERHDFRKKGTEHEICSLIVSTIFNYKRIQQDVFINVKSLQVRYLLFSSHFSET